MGHTHLPSTEAAVAAVREVARAYGLEMAVTDDIGADRTSRRTSAGAFAVLARNIRGQGGSAASGAALRAL
ncbi:hypothetical protein ACFV6Z_33860 [Streptomyces sp. NPDC059818]|uniref:hypothetical protein n=1 Tax=Streptomyces sp. NPDC059818 TaxID=3346962 RepID=UPI0036673308